VNLNEYLYRVRQPFLWYYRYFTLREPKLKSLVHHEDPRIHKETITKLKENVFNIIDFEIDVADYRRYISMARFPNYYGGGKAGNFVEKSLEHYLAAKLLDLSRDDVFIDIASELSPASEIYHEIFGCKVYRQDLAFPEGIHGNKIGGDASNMPVKDGFATKMALHCSFENFPQQDSDIKFINEANRVLAKGGKLCIVPLYLFSKYAVETDLAVWPKGSLYFEPDAVLYCAKGTGTPYARFYDVNHLITRIRNNLDGLKLTVYVTRNEKEISGSCYVKFIALFESVR
jgi:SAM-dependent methyltransferase